MRLEEVTATIVNDMNKKKDQWFLQTLEKHNLIKSDDLSNFDLFWLSSEMGVKIETSKEKTKVFIENLLVGEWFEEYTLIKIDENIYKFITECWN